VTRKKPSGEVFMLIRDIAQGKTCCFIHIAGTTSIDAPQRNKRSGVSARAELQLPKDYSSRTIDPIIRKVTLERTIQMNRTVREQEEGGHRVAQALYQQALRRQAHLVLCNQEEWRKRGDLIDAQTCKDTAVGKAALMLTPTGS